MSRYTGSSYKQARRTGFSLLENGKELARRPYGPGQHGNDRKRRQSTYGEQLKEKNKVRFMYGLNERQFHKTFVEAGKLSGVHGTNFLILPSAIPKYNSLDSSHITLADIFGK